MNYNQNEKIAQITSQTLIVGVDIAKYKHVARAQDFRGQEFKKAFHFENTNSDFNHFLGWIQQLMKDQGMEKVIVGMEPTGHYWLNLAHFLKDQRIQFVVVNPMHVKKSKELDDNSPTKNDVKDARVIAQLVKDGRYAVPNIPQGVYAELRVAKKIRDLLSVDLQAVQGQIHNWLDRFFPEFLTVFKDWEGKSALQLLKLNVLPHELSKISDHEILTHLRKAVSRAVGLSRISELKQAASHSIGILEGSTMAKLELRTLIDKYELINNRFEELDSNIDGLLEQIPGVEQMLAITGIGRDTVASFFSEVGDLSYYSHPKQIIKLAGLSLRENTSGKHKGQTKITKRGRKALRALLFRVAMPLVAKNSAFKALHQYFTTRSNNPLKKMQSLIAICNKLIRILFTIGKKQCEFSEEHMLRDIPHMAELTRVA
ncbi:IS110 family RNA-guided transposase [Paenibacillus macquariensis]|uniref:Transposase IS116/IS110/IS902 family protein n=1 Tax=Paenibacillus macquariensis TaxID=948756 RepID=A0ABY1KDR2_9BACL|nr:IS110 family transposase [Paenibacillus macquariensis]MEC0094359.1 IS110 family transposase [Paenibacillus macquariensis]OAB37001.1 transposase [Paenibacillus macquariensis subsp. macquariensis]SIR67609.1 Transposase IS116/IS110/IS902 family protein [Paenibacillus macquariensis]